MNDLHDLELLLRSDRPILAIESVEEPRILTLFAGLALRLNQPAFRWVVTEGLARLDLDDPVNERLSDPAELLRFIKVTPQRGVYLLWDFYPFLTEPLHVRLIKSSQRRALQTAVVMAPCVLRLDEIEKGLAAGSEGDGLGQRILDTLLTWMAERKAPVFLVATSDIITRLPPELAREGRLDETFFVDLPDQSVRRAIFAIHLRRRDRRYPAPVGGHGPPDRRVARLGQGAHSPCPRAPIGLDAGPRGRLTPLSPCESRTRHQTAADSLSRLYGI